MRGKQDTARQIDRQVSQEDAQKRREHDQKNLNRSAVILALWFPCLITVQLLFAPKALAVNLLLLTPGAYAMVLSAMSSRCPYCGKFLPAFFWAYCPTCIWCKRNRRTGERKEKS